MGAFKHGAAGCHRVSNIDKRLWQPPVVMMAKAKSPDARSYNAGPPTLVVIAEEEPE